MIWNPDDFPGSRPARRADGKEWFAEQMHEQPARLAQAPVTTVRRDATAQAAAPVPTPSATVSLAGHDGARARENTSGLKPGLSPSSEMRVAEVGDSSRVDTREKGSGLKPEPSSSVETMARSEIETSYPLGDEGPPAPASTSPVSMDDALKAETADFLPAKLLTLLAKYPEGVSVRDALRSRVAAGSAACAELLNGLATAGHLTRHAQRPAAGGKAVVTFRLP